MSTATKNYGQVKLTSSYTAYTKNTGSGNTYRTSSANNADSATFYADFATLGIPAGSTINSAYFTYTQSTSPLHGTDTKALMSGSDVVDSWFNSGDSVVFGSISSFYVRFKTDKTNTNYPATPGIGVEVSQTNSSTWTIDNLTLVVDYTLPYSACTPPSSVSVSPSSTGPSKNATLSWSGAGAGSSNAITGYQLYRSTSPTSGYTALGSKISSTATSGSTTVASHATNGTAYYYKVATIGTQSGYDSGQSSVYATLTTTWTNPTPPNSVTGSNNVVPGSTQEIGWSGASDGTNNPITGYELYYSGDNYAAAIASVGASTLKANVTAHSTSGSSYTYKVKVLSALGGVMSTASHTMTSLRGNVTAPTSVSLSKNDVAPSEQVSVSWSGEAGGTNNAILKYEIETSTNGTTFTKLAEDSASPHSPIAASATNGGKIYVRIKVIGEVGSATSSAVELITTVTKPNAPSVISINDSENVLHGAQRTLSWSGASAGTNNTIKGYRIMRSVDGGAYTQLGTDIITAATSGTLEVTAKASNGTHEYKIHTLGNTTVTAEQVSAVSTISATLTALVTNPTAPTVSVPTNVAPGSTQSLSWSGAVDGVNNPITTYDIYEKVDGGAWTKIISDGTSPYAALEANTANGGTKSYYIIAIGTSGRGNSGNSNTAIMTTTVGKPNAPSSVTVADGTSSAPNVDKTLSWSGASAGTNNSIKGYRIMLSVDGGAYAQYGSDILSTATSGTATVKSKNGNGVHSYKIVTLGNTLTLNSDQSTASATLTTVIGAPSAPNNVSIADGSAVPPSSTRTLVWSGAVGGTNNPIRGYQIHRSVDGGAYAPFGSAIITSATSGSLSVASSSTTQTYTYKVQTLGSTLNTNSELSSVVGTLATQRAKSTGVLNKGSITATGVDSISVDITRQTGTSYTHKVTWFIPATSYTSGEQSLTSGTLSASYAVPQTWILATTKTTTSVTAKCRIETFDGTESLGFNEYPFTVNVPQKSSFTLAKTSVDITGVSPGNNTVTIATGYSGYKHKVTWYANETYQTTRAVAASASPSDSYTFPIEWNNVAPNAPSFSILCTVETIKVTSDGDMSLGTHGVSFTGNVPASIVPTVTSLTPSQVDAYWGLYVRTKSKCRLSPVASGAYSSSIVSYEITWGVGNTSGTQPYSAGASWTTGILDIAGSITYSVKVTDSRGRVATGSASPITVTNYNSPSIVAASYFRANSGGNIDYAAGTYIKATAQFAYSEIGSNAFTAKAYYRVTGAPDWLPVAGSAITIQTDKSGAVTYGGGLIAIGNTYQTKIVLSDFFTSVEHLGQISTISRVFDVREDRAGFGRIATNTKELTVPSDWKFTVGTNEVLHMGNYGNVVAAKSHTHTKANITDFPASMPASDVAAWAKAATKPSYAWSEIGSKPSTFDPSTHTHVKSEITDFPTSMPASDVSAWAKATSKPSYVWSEIGSKPTTFTPSTHNHVKSEITDFPTSMPASDVSAWAKASTKPSYTAAEVGAAAVGHGHALLNGWGDTRGNNTTPNDYNGSFEVTGMKSTAAVGSPMSGTYVSIFGFRGWSDSSGGTATEMAFGDEGISFRQGATTSWGAWYRLLHSGNYTSYCTPANIGAATSGHGHSNATTSANGFMSSADKTALDTVVGRVNQALLTTSSPTFNVVTATKVIGAVYA